MITINGNNLTLDKFVKIVINFEKIEIDQLSIDKVNQSSEYVKKVVHSQVPTYGINTGFGHLSCVSINEKDTSRLQENLLKSHACGVGEPLEDIYVRGMMLLRVNALIKGHSGIRMSVIQKLVEFLNKGLIPVVYAQGSLGASGDLAPLAHMALPLIGLGELKYNGQVYDAIEALDLTGIKPIKHLEAKEGLALINGTQAMASIAAINLYRAIDLFNLSIHTLALTMEALNGIIDVLEDDIHLLRNQTGQQYVAKRLKSILSDSKLTTHQGEKRVQDAYSLRCSPQVLGASLDAINYVHDVVEKEMNAVTDNPLVFPLKEKVLSAGNFHGQPLALAMDFLSIAVAEIANISERRLERMVNPTLNNGLPAFLVKNPGINSGFMIVQYSAASLVSENKVLAHPSSVDSIPSSANQEDHVSMGNHASRKCTDIINNVYKVVSMELLTALQAIDLVDSSRLSSRTHQIYKHIRQDIPFIENDQIMYRYIHKIEKMVQSNEFKKILR